METQARIWNRQVRNEGAVSEALYAIEHYDNLGAVGDLERCRAFLQDAERSVKKPPTSCESDPSGKFLEINLLLTPVNFPSSTPSHSMNSGSKTGCTVGRASRHRPVFVNFFSITSLSAY